MALSKCLSSETSLGEKALESLEEKGFSNPSSANEKMNTMGESKENQLLIDKQSAHMAQ